MDVVHERGCPRTNAANERSLRSDFESRESDLAKNMARMETVTRFFDELHSLSVLQAQLIEEGVEMKVHVCKTLPQKASQRDERGISLMSGLRFKVLFYPLFLLLCIAFTL